jgi:cardiolipin synthase
MKKHFESGLFLRLIIISLLLVAQLLLLVLATLRFTEYFPEFYFACMVLSIIVVLLVINGRDNPGYKLALVIPIMLFPVFGGLFYLLFSRGRMRKIFYKSRIRLLAEEEQALSQAINADTTSEHGSASLQFTYIRNNSGYPAFRNTSATYYELGEILFEQMKNELRKAQRYIFLEYFIIDQGKMWNEILEILLEKVAQGVDVRIIYDGIGCVKTLPYKYYQKLRDLGIRCEVFNPFIPVATIWHNIRNHRKIMVIDGHTAFTGGINLADEYINVVERYGHWKDAGIMIKGSAAWSFTTMFLSMWCVLSNTTEDYEDYLSTEEPDQGEGLVQPFSDIPSDNIQLGRDAYLNMISRAQKYIYIMSPYFIVDNETLTALCLAAKSGVDVRLIAPHIGDSWYVHLMTRSYYEDLIANGVAVYEYTPGFIHAKNMVCDDELAICGSINFDYRSFYLQMECAVLLYHCQSVIDMKRDFENTQQKCLQIMADDCYHDPWYNRFLRMLLKIFAPLM